MSPPPRRWASSHEIAAPLEHYDGPVSGQGLFPCAVNCTVLTTLNSYKPNGHCRPIWSQKDYFPYLMCLNGIELCAGRASPLTHLRGQSSNDVGLEASSSTVVSWQTAALVAVQAPEISLVLSLCPNTSVCGFMIPCDFSSIPIFAICPMNPRAGVHTARRTASLRKDEKIR